MAAAARTIRLASRLAVGPRLSAGRTAASAISQRAAFSVSARTLKSSGVVHETEIPVSVYTPDSKGVGSSNSDHFSIPVKAATQTSSHAAEENEDITPLDQQSYEQMPPTLQKMTVWGKVVIVTG
jgi:hypothetical protein